MRCTPFFALALFLGYSNQNLPAEEVSPTVFVDAVEATVLAKGYVRAFPELRRGKGTNIVLRRDGRIFTIVDVRELKAVEGVLVATAGAAGDRYLINPKDVVFITDGEYNLKD